MYALIAGKSRHLKNCDRRHAGALFQKAFVLPGQEMDADLVHRIQRHADHDDQRRRPEPLQRKGAAAGNRARNALNACSFMSLKSTHPNTHHPFSHQQKDRARQIQYKRTFNPTKRITPTVLRIGSAIHRRHPRSQIRSSILVWTSGF